MTEDDFNRLASEIDPYIDRRGGLAGLILEIEEFPGWEDFGAALRHFRFVRDHHRKIMKVAVVTDTLVGTLAEHISSHFVAAQIRHFGAGQVGAAKKWMAGNYKNPQG